MQQGDRFEEDLQTILAMLDSIAEGIYCIDSKGICVYCNQRCVILLKYADKSELIGQDMHQLIHYHHRDGSEYPVENCRIYQAFQAGSRVHVDDEVFWRKDGTPFDVEYHSFPVIRNQETVGAVVSFIDYSVAREEAAYRNQLSWLVESSYDAILGKDLNGIINFWNHGAERVYGYSTEEALGQSVSIILPTDQESEEPEIQQALQQGRELTQFVVKRRRSDGETRDISVTLSPVFNSFGELVGSSSIEQDITERIRNESELLEAKQEIERALTLAQSANRARADFVANISHELRTPMNAILGMLQLALDEELDPQLEDYIETARSSATSLLHLVNEILDFSKIESGKFELIEAPFDLRVEIENAAKALSQKAGEKGLEICCEIDPNIPSSLLGDGRRIQQVINNLLGNAVKFTEVGEIIVRVRIKRKFAGNLRLEFSVSDTGVGIPQEAQERIFAPFAQADMSSTRSHQGTGLGLSICRELVQLMGSKLKLTSKVNEGSTFRFELTLAVDDASKPTDRYPETENIRVLLVDDNATNLRILEKILVSWSMQPIVAENGKQALKILKESHSRNENIELALIDGLMPGIDGIELARQIADEHGPDSPPVILMQAFSDRSLAKEKIEEVPVAELIAKPVSQSELLNAVAQALNLYKETPTLPISQFSESPPRKLSVLLAEDNSANQKVATAMLKKRGHRVEVVSNGRLAVEYLDTQGESIDVVLMDVQMPVMDGLQATSAIRKLEDKKVAQIPIVALTARALHGDREACLAAGMDAYISKPLDVKQLIEVTETIVFQDNPQSSISRKDATPERRQPTESHAVQSEEESAELTAVVHDQLKLVELDVALKRLGGDAELFREFVTIFMEDAPGIFESLYRALEQGNAQKAESHAHALKGLISNFGASACVSLLQRIEKAGRRGKIDSVTQEKAAEFKELYEEFCRELKMFA